MTRKSKLSMATDLPAIIPSREMFAFETLAARERAAERRFSARLVQENLLPSELLAAQGELEIDGDTLRDKVHEILGGITTAFSVSIFRDLQYPEQLRQVRHALAVSSCRKAASSFVTGSFPSFGMSLGILTRPLMLTFSPYCFSPATESFSSSAVVAN